MLHISIALVLILGPIISNYSGFTRCASVEWFSQKELFPLLEYDLLETQTYTVVFFLKAKNENYQAAYIPVNLGLRKSFLQ